MTIVVLSVLFLRLRCYSVMQIYYAGAQGSPLLDLTLESKTIMLPDGHSPEFAFW